MAEVEARRLAVLGSPIAHSKSPELHAAAYRVLGLPWEYGRHELRGDGLPGFLGSLGREWRGLSLTMPLKRDVLPLLDSRTPTVDDTGAANTVLLVDRSRHGFNTDVAGIVAALADHGVTAPGAVHIIGTGATATSALVAAARMGTRDVLVTGRDPAGLGELERLGERLGVAVRTRRYGDPIGVPALVINTLPGGVEPVDVPDADAGDVLLEVPYDPWPSPRVERWRARGAEVVSGLEMLLHQAVAQVRIFVTGDEASPLESEREVVAAMRAAIGLGGAGAAAVGGS